MPSRSHVVGGWILLWGSTLAVLSGCFSKPPRPSAAPNSYACVCDCADAAGSRTATASVLASTDDAEEVVTGTSAGTVIVNGQALEMTTTTLTQIVGLRFAGVAVPQGATIDAATVQFVAQRTLADPTSLTFHGEAAGNAAAFAATARNLSDRTRTVASGVWTVPAWNIADGAGASERTPDLKAIVQEIVNRPDWAQGNALALIVSGSGLRAAWAYDGQPGSAAVLNVAFTMSGTPIEFVVSVCVPPEYNANLTDGVYPTEDELAADCSERVSPTVQGLAAACGYPACSCAVEPADVEPRFAAVCDEACVENVLNDNCSDFNPTTEPPVVTATNAAGDTPVCTVHSPLASAMYGLRSECRIPEVAGNATLVVMDDGDENAPEDQPEASGRIHLVGRPCPGGACDVGVEFGLVLDDVTFSNFWGSRTFTDLAAVGGTLPAERAGVDASGEGLVLAETTESSGRGRDGDEELGIVSTNDEPLALTADWAGKTCALVGAAAGVVDPEAKRCAEGPQPGKLCATSADCGPPTEEAPCTDGDCACEPVESTNDMRLTLDVSGPLVNQPPTANAGPDRNVECNGFGGARFLLDGTGSSDPDGNLVDQAWFRGGRTAADAIGWSLVNVAQQPLGPATSYRLRVIDGFGQADEDTTLATVVDTTGPSVSCGTPDPARITPPTGERPATFTASVVDVCDPAATASLSNVSCFFFTKGGKKVIRDDCRFSVAGGTITITDTGGVDDHIAWTASSTDASGNVGTTGCEVVVARPPPK